MNPAASSVPLSAAALPSWEGVLPVWPGALEDGTFVRRATGTGTEPALFVHGLGGAATNWTDLMGLLADEVAGEAMDLPGFGWSEPARSGSYRLDQHVAAVRRRIETRGAGPVHLFGNSLGGAVATRLAATRPDLVRTLTLVSPALPDLRPRKGTDPLLPLLFLPGASRFAGRQLRRRSAASRALSVIRLCYAEPDQIPPQRVAEAIAEVSRREGLPYAEAAFFGSLRGLASAQVRGGPRSLWQQARSVRVPTLLIWGAEDRLVDVAVAPKAAAAFPQSRLLVLPGVGHVAQMEQPETVARAFLALRDDVRAQGVHPAAP